MTTADSRAMLLLRWGLQLVIEAGQLQGEYSCFAGIEACPLDQHWEWALNHH